MKALLYELILRRIYEHHLVQIFDTIKICDVLSLEEGEQQLFRSRTVKALELVKEHDIRRYRRIQKRLAYIVNCRVLTAGAYSHPLRTCAVNISAMGFHGEEDEDMKALILAGIFVHEATHGEIEAHNIPYDKAHRMRVERSCYQEEVRFMQRVMPEVALREFDEGWYVTFHQRGMWKNTVDIIRNIIQANRRRA